MLEGLGRQSPTRTDVKHRKTLRDFGPNGCEED